VIKGTAATLDEKMALLDLTSPPRNGDLHAHKNSKDNSMKGKILNKPQNPFFNYQI
jgi:hypothetical protein